LFGAHHTLTFDEFFGRSTLLLSVGLLLFCLSWVLYVALEPYVRRRWPATLVSWSRLLAGDFRDPVVGRDVLAGCLLGAFSIVLVRVGWFVPVWLGRPPLKPFSGPQWQFLGARTIIADVSNRLISAPLYWLAGLFVLFLLRALLRKEWAAAIVWVLLFTVLAPPSADQYAPVVLVRALIVNSLQVFLLIRFGLLALVATEVFNNILGSFPLTTQGSSWYASMSLAGIVLLAAIALYAFYTSLGGRPIFGGAVLEE
jgi:serine/threonine-protein kinase